MTSSERQPVAAWQAEHLRLTLFHSPTNIGAGVWREFTHEDPSEQTTQAKAAIIREQGPFRGGVLVTEIRPDRVDVVHSAAMDAASSLPIIGPCESLFSEFVQSGCEWLSTQKHDVRRVALGSALLLPGPDRETGYRRLAAYLPFAPDPSAFDFVYQINRRRDSTSVPQLLLNRLSRWSVVKVQATAISFAPGTSTAYAIGDPTFACRMELDVNTAVEGGTPIPPNRMADLLHELATLSHEIIESGDQK